MSARWFTLLPLALPFLLIMGGCTRSTEQGASNIVIQIPKRFGKTGSALPADRKLCWGASVSGQGIDGLPAGTCSPATGTVLGYKAEGEVLEGKVKKGTSRKIDLYLYLMPAGDTSACPAMKAVFLPAQLTSTYLVGSTTTDLLSEKSEVEITADFPGETKHLAATLAMPASCTTMNGPGPGRGVALNAARGDVSGAGLRIKATVGATPGAMKTSGGGYTIQVK